MKQKDIPLLTKWIVIIVTVLIIINTLWLNILYRHELFLMSLQFIIDYQNKGTSFTQFVYNIISLISGTQFTIAFLILIIILTFRKANAFVLVLYVAANTYIMAIAKIAFADPRPTWYSDQIHQLQWKCQYTYGFPSGHCWIILILHQAIFTDIIGTGPFQLFLLEPLFFIVLVPFSRLYLGSHAADQIEVSITYSFAFAILYKLQLQYRIFQLFKYLLHPKNKIKAFFAILGLQILIMIPPIILYEINTNQKRLGYFYLQRLNTVCSENYSLKDIQGRQAAQSSIGNVVVGILYGLILFRTDSFNKQNKRLRVAYFFTGKWNYGQKRIRNFFLFMLVYIIPGAIILVIFFLVIPGQIQNFYGKYYLMSLAWILTTIYWIRYVPHIGFRFRLIEEDQEQNQNPHNNEINQNNQIVDNNIVSSSKVPKKGVSTKIKSKQQPSHI